jgi:hypothetical protein
MVFKVPDPQLLVSNDLGDGTSSPQGPRVIAIFRQPPEKWLLKPGDVVEARIEKLGTLRNRIVENNLGEKGKRGTGG